MNHTNEENSNDSDSDDDPSADDFHNVVHNHSDNLLKGNGMQFADPINSPTLNQIKNLSVQIFGATITFISLLYFSQHRTIIHRNSLNIWISTLIFQCNQPVAPAK